MVAGISSYFSTKIPHRAERWKCLLRRKDLQGFPLLPQFHTLYYYWSLSLKEESIN